MGDPDSYVDYYEFQVPIFVLTSEPPQKLPKQNERLTFTFVTEGIESAIIQAKAAAGDKDVTVVGGASTAQACLRAGLVDELHLDLMPVLLGESLRLFEHLETLQGLTFTRIFDAPLEAVWKALTEAEALARWWGPRGAQIRVVRLELCPGGVFQYVQQTPGGSQGWGKLVYREVVPQSRLAFVTSFSDAAGGTARNPWNPSWPLEILNVWILEQQDGKTTLTMHGVPINATAQELDTFRSARESVGKGFKGTLDGLETYLSESVYSALVLERVFDAPRSLVFEAWTSPEHMARWWEPKGYTNPICELDARPGGAILIHMTGPDGRVIINKGIFKEIVEPERLVFTTYAFEDEAGNPRLEILNTVIFAEQEGKTRLRL